MFTRTIGWFANRHRVLPIFIITGIGYLAVGLLTSVFSSKPWPAGAASRAATANTTFTPVVVATPQIIDFDSDIIAGNRLVITGTDFSANKDENKVIFTYNQVVPPGGLEAEVDVATQTQLELNVPPGVETGPIMVKVTTSQNSTVTSPPSSKPLNVETSISGLVKDGSNGCIPNNCQGIPGVTVFKGTFTTTTKDNGKDRGVFVLPLHGLATGGYTFRMDASTANPPYGSPRAFQMPVVRGRDNIYPPTFYLLPATNSPIPIGLMRRSPADTGVGQIAESAANAYVLPPSARAATRQTDRKQNAQSSQVAFDIPPGARVRFPDGKTSGTLTRDVYERELSPTALPVGRFSSTIVQIAPIGVSITPGAALSFPNSDRIKEGTMVRLFRLDLREAGDTAGKFVDAGPATVTPEGRVKAVNPVTETGYYFVSPEYQMVKLEGRVLNSSNQPVRQAVVTVRGQSTLTDAIGKYSLVGVPVLSSAPQAILRVNRLRADGGVDSAERPVNSVAFSPMPINVPDVILQVSAVNVLQNRPPRIYAPSVINLPAKPSDWEFKVRDPDNEQISVSLAGANFAKLNSKGGDIYRLRVAPKSKKAGAYILTITAVDSKGTKATHTILLRKY